MDSVQFNLGYFVWFDSVRALYLFDYIGFLVELVIDQIWPT